MADDPLAQAVATVQDGLKAEPTMPAEFPTPPDRAFVVVKWENADGDDFEYRIGTAGDLRLILAALHAAREDAAEVDAERKDFCDTVERIVQSKALFRRVAMGVDAAHLHFHDPTNGNLVSLSVSFDAARAANPKGE